MRIISIGEVLWDVFPHQELLGGAPLNFCVNAVRLGHQAALITAVGNDERGARTVSSVAALGVGTDFIQRVRDAKTGVALVSTTPEGEPLFRIPRPAAFDYVALSSEATQALLALRPDWLYMGTLFQMQQQSELLTRGLIESLPGVQVFYDMNLREGSWTLQLVERLCREATLLKLNEFEAELLAPSAGLDPGTFTLEKFCAVWAERFEIETVCVTLGPAGCLVFDRGESTRVPGYPAVVQDTVGAGDAFAAAFLHGRSKGWCPEKAARFANAVGSVVASRSGATPDWQLEECTNIAAISPDED